MTTDLKDDLRNLHERIGNFRAGLVRFPEMPTPDVIRDDAILGMMGEMIDIIDHLRSAVERVEQRR